ncbi:MAG: enoyl-CoA hydratase-related protein [Pseudomonadota bacterium]|nr:enoyl-CoA hydratase-related protein [Pseudomonadota bacterium]MDP1904700.1 enoyl-CoA hydratase-related protein [Pseudomonadota bacterium]MDP2352890.1 enoyl-CoA hydratase-related protein [Pseudomonadota bacterium]
MRILFLTHAFNSLTQRLYVELTALGHEISIEFDINDSVTVEAVELFRPHLILAPYLRRAIPEAIWRRHVCLIVHPGIVGDRGPSALDWAILDGESEWGVTVLQAEAEMDAGPVWASATFPMRVAKKSSLYRNEVTEATVRAVRAALERLPDYRAGTWKPTPLAQAQLRPLMKQTDRAIDWRRDDTVRVLAKLNCGDGFPGVRDSLFGQACHLYNAAAFAAHGEPGALLGRVGEGVVRATVDGAVWIGHAKTEAVGIKLPVLEVFPETSALEVLDAGENPPQPPFCKGGGQPTHADRRVPPFAKGGTGGISTTPEIHYEESTSVGYLHFDFYNGAMSTAACQHLLAAYEAARRRPTKVIVLMGGEDFFSNGLDLNYIEAAASPPEESWRNINAMDDLCRAILSTESQLTVSALRGNAGAGGAFLALAADQVWARRGVILNPHYKNMGNLYGSEYWSYLLPRRVGAEQAAAIMRNRLPLGAEAAVRMGFLDAAFGDDLPGFTAEVQSRAQALAAGTDFNERLQAKLQRRAHDEAAKPLESYRGDELKHMQRNFYGFDPSYHVARHHFVRKTLNSWTPRHLAIHRELGWVVPEDVEG